MARIDQYEELDDEDVVEEGIADPFSAPWHERVIGSCLWFLDAVRFWVLWPVHAIGRSVNMVFGDVAWRGSQVLGWLGDLWHRCAFATLEFLRVDQVRGSVRELKTSTVQSVDNMTDGMMVGTRGIRIVFFRIQQGLAWLLVKWYDFLELTRNSPTLRVLTLPLRWATFAVRDVADFAVGWVFTRNYRHLLFGIPAFLLMMPLAYCAVRMPFHTSAAKAKHYRMAADAAIKDEDRVAAELYFRKLTQLGHVHEHVTFRTGLLAASQDNIDEAYEKMKQIAKPHEAGGLAEAHVWIAQSIALSDIEQDNPNSNQLLEDHLQRAHELLPDNTSVKMMLAESLASNKKDAEALSLLDSVPESEMTDSAKVKHADLLARQQQGLRAAKIAAELEQNYNQRDANEEELTVDEYLNWAIASELQGRLPRAAKILLEAREQHPDDERLTQTAREVLLQYAEALPQDSLADGELRITLLQWLSQIAENPEPALTQLANLLLNPAMSAMASRVLKDYSSNATLPARTLKVLGDVEMVRGQPMAAREFYERSIRQNPNEHVALNNLAYLLANLEPIDLERALGLADRAVQIEPDNPHYLETRGQILIQLGRWDDAVADLSIALNGMPYKLEIHESLGTAYAQLGQQKLAEFHKARAKR